MSDFMSSGRREEYRDFVERYDKGTLPYDDISDEEALDRYHAGGEGSMTSNPAAKAALVVVATMAIKRAIEG